MRGIKKALSLILVFIALLGTVTVFATTYTTKVSLGPGFHLTGSLRSYNAGSPSIKYTLKYFNKYNNQNYSKFNWKAIDANDYVQTSVNVSLSATDVGIRKSSTTTKKVSKGKYKFYFSTKVDNTTYSGIYMDPVYLIIE